MASKVSPQSNMKILNEPFACHSLSEENYSLEHFVKFGEAKDYFNYKRSGYIESGETSVTVMPFNRSSVIACNNNIFMDGYYETKKSTNENDDDRHYKPADKDQKKTVYAQNEYQGPGSFQQNLYQPYVPVYAHKKSKFYFRGNQPKKNTKYSDEGDEKVYGYVESSENSLTLMPFPHSSVITCNNNVFMEEIMQSGFYEQKNSAKYFEGHESDDEHNYRHCKTTSDKDSEVQHFPNQKKTVYAQNEYQGASSFQQNLYQPNVHAFAHKKSKYYFRGNQRKKNTKYSDETDRKVYGLMRRFQSRAHKLKIDPQVLLDGGPWDTLNREIWDTIVSKIQKEETYISKLNFWKAIFVFFKKCPSNYGLYLVGSTMSGLALEGSDIDICLLTKPYSNEPREDSLYHLNYLQQVLLKNGFASQAELIMAKVPILKFKNKETGFDIDLNCNNVVGIQNTRLLYCYTQLDWRVRPLVVIVKIWAQANNINDAKNMTISSYSWTLMVIHYLQCGVFPPVLPCLHTLHPEEFTSHENRALDVQGEIEGLKEFESENTRCLGDLLIGFFHYYSYFNYQDYAISVRTGSRLPIEQCKQAKSPKNAPHQWKFLCIEEPFDQSNTARSVFDLEVFKHIKKVIVQSYKDLVCNKILSRILPLMISHDQR